MAGDDGQDEASAKIRVTADTGLNGVLEAHNLLAQKVIDLSKAFEEFKTNSATSSEEQKKELANRFEALEGNVEQKGKGLEAVQEKVKKMEDSSEAEKKALRHSIDEISQHQADLKSRILPDWETGLQMSIKKLREDLIAIQGGLEERVSAAEQASAELQEMFKNDEGFKLAGVLRSQVNSLEAFVKRQDQIVTAAYNSRLEQLENALKHSDYERLIFTERASQDLQGMSQHLRGFSTLLNDISQHLETLDQRSPNDLTQLKAEMQQLKDTTSKLWDGYASSQARNEELAASHAAHMAKLGSSHVELQQRLKSELERLESSGSKTELERLQRLESDFHRERSERLDFMTKLEKEERERSEVWQRRTTEIDQPDRRWDLLRTDLDELKLDFQSFIQSEDSRIMDVARLEALIRALEDRAWPWRRNAKGSRGPTRSPSPDPVTVDVEVPANPWGGGTVNPDWEMRETQRPRGPVGPIGPRWYQSLSPSGLPALSPVRAVRQGSQRR